MDRIIPTLVAIVGLLFVASLSLFTVDQRQYATDLGNGPGLLNRAIPPEVSAQYTLTRPFNVNNAATPPSYQLVLTPATGSTPASQNDGSLILNSLSQRWREVDGNLVYNPQSGGIGDCTWEAGNCVPH